MPSPRPLLAAASIAALLLTGCGGDDSEASDEVTPVKGVSTTSAPAATSTTEGPNATTAEPSTTAPTNTAPPSTKPPTTAPPSALLDEVLAAYDAAYADLLAAEAIPDENYPPLLDHMDTGQADTWRNVIRGLREKGQRIRPHASTPSWRRVESVEQPDETTVLVDVCRYDTEETIDAAGTVVDGVTRIYRYVDTFALIGGSWKWAGREWVDPSPDYSDCALQ